MLDPLVSQLIEQDIYRGCLRPPVDQNLGMDLMTLFVFQVSTLHAQD